MGPLTVSHRRFTPTATPLLVVVAALAMMAGACSGEDRATSTASVPTASVSPPRSTTTVAGALRPGSETGDLENITVRLTEIATADAPTAMVSRAGTDSLYVAERAGVVRILRRTGDRFKIDPEPVLDISRKVADLSGERGLLGLAFSPDGKQLYVSYTDGHDAGASVIASYPMAGDRAETGSALERLRLPQPFSNHNGGNIVFGPDGYLYVGFGDGGGQDDPNNNGQNPATLLATILRIDVLDGRPGQPYTVPEDNPFVGDAAARDEVWLTGVRNPWRFSFDRATGDLWIGDVGGSKWEEVDVLPAAGGTGRGTNLGWSLREGAHNTSKSGDRSVRFVDPIFEYSHDEGASITGGFVYRGGRLPSLTGVYLFSDFAAATLRAIATNPDATLRQQAVLDTTGANMSQVSSFAQDADGEIYILSLDGKILRIDPA